MGGAPDSGIKIVNENRRARFDYYIVEAFEAGMVLTGAEIKSIRANGITIQGSYVKPLREELFLLGATIRPYKFNADPDYDPTRSRKLLLHKHQIHKLMQKSEQKGFTIVPLKVYLKGGLAKIEIALAKGKEGEDKRDVIHKREADRNIRRAMKHASVGRPRGAKAR